MNHSSKLLGIQLLCLFTVLLSLQVTLGFFSPKNANSSNSQQAPPISSRSLIQKPTATTVITGGRGGVNQIDLIPDHTPDLSPCNGISSTPVDFLRLLAPGWTINSLEVQYRNETRQILCYDKWKTEWNVPGGTWVHIGDFLNIMGWPSDLFDPQAGTQVLIMSGPDTFKTPTNTTDIPQQSNLNCKWEPTGGISIDICDFASMLLKVIVLTPLKWAVSGIAGDANTNSIFWTTPPHLTYANPDLGTFWNISLYIVNALLVLAVAWAGIRYMAGSAGSWQMRADLVEMLPRLILALMAAYLSVRICQIAIDGSNALDGVFSHTLILDLSKDPKDLFPLFYQIIMCILVLLLVLEEVVRYAILFVLIGFGPVWAFSGAFRETQFIFKGALKALFAIAFLQPAQIAVMDLGQHLTKDLAGNAGTPLYYLVSIALMLFVLFMMSWFLRAGGISLSFGSVGLAGLVIGAAVARKMVGGTTRTVGGAGRRFFRGSIFDKSNERGSNTAGNTTDRQQPKQKSSRNKGSNNIGRQLSRDRRSNNDNPNFNEDGTRKRPARQLSGKRQRRSTCDPHKREVFLKSRRVKQMRKESNRYVRKKARV
jgi:hypothetical protein